MRSALQKLLSISSAAISPREETAEQVSRFLSAWNLLGTQLGALITERNGFWAFESALLVRPLSKAGIPHGLIEWNDPTLWKSKFGDELNGVLFFAEDVFGCQFAIRNRYICTFDPETGRFEDFSDSLESWATRLLEDSEFRTGYPLAHDWQNQNHPLKAGSRLLPKLPFVVGGKFEVSNLYESDEVDGMVFRAYLASQIRNVPDGGEIILEIVDKPPVVPPKNSIR
jgi:hypothetical protein